MEDESTNIMIWVLEAAVFPDSHSSMRAAVLAAGHEVVLWRDRWNEDGGAPRFEGRSVLFHGSLENADRISRAGLWRPGAFCASRAFHCSAWYPRARNWLLHRSWIVVPANELVMNPSDALHSLGAPASVFIRPDSPLKPFSGRVLQLNEITLRSLDHGYYYEDEALPVVVAPVRDIGNEWRYVVVDGLVVAGSAYHAGTRTSLPDSPTTMSWEFATLVARDLEPPEDVYVLDVCEADGEMRLLELNPFSGADLYACSRSDIVRAVSRYVLSNVS